MSTRRLAEICCAVLGVFTLACSFGPDEPAPVVRVAMAYPGASPEEVEMGVVLALEEALASVPGVVALRSTAVPGEGSVLASLAPGTAVDPVLGAVVESISHIQSFPEDAETPVVHRVHTATALELVVSRVDAEATYSALLSTPGILNVHRQGDGPVRTVVEIDPRRLEALGIPVSEVLSACVDSSLDVPAGWYAIRTDSPQTNAGDWVVRPGVRLSDLATIREVPPDPRVFWHGEPAVVMGVAFADSTEATVPNSVTAKYQRVEARHSVWVAGPSEPELAVVAQQIAATSEDAVVTLWPDRARVAFPDLPDRDALSALALPGTELHWPTGIGAEIVLSGPRGEVLSDAMLADITRALQASPKVSDVRLPSSEPELHVEIDRDQAARYGVLASRVQQTVRMIRGDDVGAVQLRWPEGTGLDDLMVPTASGTVPLTAIASVSLASGPASIERLDGQRVQALAIELTEVGAEVPLDGLELPVGWTATLR